MSRCCRLELEGSCIRVIDVDSGETVARYCAEDFGISPDPVNVDWVPLLEAEITLMARPCERYIEIDADCFERGCVEPELAKTYTCIPGLGF